MKVLMLGSRAAGLAHEAVDELTSAGHQIVRCDAPDDRAPCRGLAAGGGCPLDAHVDVAVLLPEPGQQDLEHGAICALRDRVPVVVVDPTAPSAPSTTTLMTTAAGPDLVAECERIAHDGRAHARAVADRLRALGVVEPGELRDGTIGIDVRRDADRVRMTVRLAASEGHRRAEIVRAATQALRDFDRRPAVIDVTVRSGPHEDRPTAMLARNGGPLGVPPSGGHRP